MKWWPLVWRSTHELELRINQQIRDNQDAHIAVLVNEHSRERTRYLERIGILEQLLERITLTKAGLLKRNGTEFVPQVQEAIPPEIFQIINGFRNPDIRREQLLDVLRARETMSWDQVRDQLMKRFGGLGGAQLPGQAIGAYLDELEKLDAETDRPSLAELAREAYGSEEAPA